MSIKLTDRQNAMLHAASLREDRCLVLPPALKGGAAQKVADKLIAGGLVKEIKAKGEAPVWRRDAKGDQAFSLKLTAAGERAVAVNRGANAIAEDVDAPVESPPKPSSSPPSIIPFDAPGETAPRQGSKLALVMALLRRSQGATIVALTEATGWLPHTTRAALTGVRKRGYAVAAKRVFTSRVRLL